MIKRVWTAALCFSAALTVTSFAGELKTDGTGLRYENDDGSWKLGWHQTEGGDWYFFNADGYARTGWYSENGKRYYFRPDIGTMVADRTTMVNGEAYQFDRDGVSTRLSDRYTGWMKDDVNWYYRLPDGSCARGWKQIGRTWYYFDEDEYMKTGPLTLDGVFYYLKEDGSMAKNESCVVDGITYEFDSSGAGSVIWQYKAMTQVTPEDQKSDLEKTVDQMCDQILAGITSDGMTKREKAAAIYSWVRGSFRYSGHSATRDWVQEAYQGLRRHHGDCYTYFAVSQALLTRSGINCIEVIRYTDNDHYWNLVQLEDGWWHFDTTPRSAGGYFCLWTDEQMLAYSARHGNCFAFDRSLYPPTP